MLKKKIRRNKKLKNQIKKETTRIMKKILKKGLQLLRYI